MEINLNGIKTYYEIFESKEGSGTPFLFLHGWGSNSERWAVVAEGLTQKGFKVFVPDLPGFGRSDALANAWNMNNYTSWLEAFVKTIGLDGFYLAGHSFGGALAVKLAIKHPQEIKKLFLVSAASVRKKTASKSAIKNLAKIVNKFSFLPFYSIVRKAFYKFIIQKSDYPYVDGIMKETFKNVISEDLSQFTGFIRVPTILIWGNKDKSTPVEDAYFMKDKIPGSKIVIIPGAGHILNRECPEIVAEKIIENI